MRLRCFLMSVPLIILVYLFAIYLILPYTREFPLTQIGNIKLRSSSQVSPEAEQAAVSEMRHLAGILPEVAQENWRISLSGPRRRSEDGSMITGISFPARGKAVIYSPCGGMLGPVFALVPSRGRALILKPEEPLIPCSVAATISHEIGHLVRFRFFTQKDFDDYLRLRNYKPGTDPEELFAEDFRWLFGSETGRQIPYQTNKIIQPGSTERRVILKTLQSRQQDA
ncbi:MAG: hypothetical protein AB1500_03230 [Bacillota bacterium]